MTEENDKKVKEKPEDPVGDKDKGSKHKIYKPIDDANAAAERLEIANTKKEELIKRDEELEAKKRLSGYTEGGSEPVKKKETDEEFTERFEAGEVDLLK